MATNLAGGVCIGEASASILRIAKLDTDCSPYGGADSGIVTASLVTMTATPEIETAKRFEPTNGNGDIMYTYARPDKIKRYNLAGEMIFFDFEAMYLMFGGALILGRAAGSYSGKVIGHAMPRYDQAPTTGVYLEVIGQAIAQGAADCVSATSNPPYMGHVFGKCKLIPGDRIFEDNFATQKFTGTAENNPALFDGPWNDFPGTGYEPNSPYFQMGYSAAEYATIAATVGCGYMVLPAGS